MDFRALPPQRRQGIGRCHAGPDTGFGKRRSDRFAIFYQSLQLLGETDRSFRLGFAFRLRQPKDWRHRRCRWRASSKRCGHSCWRARRRRRSGVAAAAFCLATGFLDPACREPAQAQSERRGSACAQIAISPFTDAESSGAATARSLLGHKAKPRRELTPILEGASVTDRGDQRCRRHRADPFDFAEALADLAVAIKRCRANKACTSLVP